MKYTMNVNWPLGSVSSGKGKWDELRGYVSKLEMNGSVAVELDDKDQIESAIRAVYKLAEDMGGASNGWKFETTRRDKTVFIRKIAISA